MKILKLFFTFYFFRLWICGIKYLTIKVELFPVFMKTTTTAIEPEDFESWWAALSSAWWRPSTYSRSSSPTPSSSFGCSLECETECCGKPLKRENIQNLLVPVDSLRGSWFDQWTYHGHLMFCVGEILQYV